MSLSSPPDSSSAPSLNPSEATAEALRRPPKVNRPDRQTVRQVTIELDRLLPPDHNARMVWAYVQRMDLDPWYDDIASREGGSGRPATDPALLMALWLYATLEGVGSARQLARLCTDHVAYRWLCGGVAVNYHTLADFRVAHPDRLEALLVTAVATLLQAGLVDMARVAQDGVRVRAHAGAASFRRRKTLDKHLQLAQEQVQQLREEVYADPDASNRRRQAAQRRAAEDRLRRLEAALAQMPAVEAQWEKNQRKKKKPDPPPPPGDDPPPTAKKKQPKAPRVSSTDPDSRVMKMADGGYRPAYNAQVATDTTTQIVVGVALTNEGTDSRQLEPMVAQVEVDYDQRPGAMLVDGGFVKLEAIERLEGQGVTIIAPVPTPKDSTRDPYVPLAGDGPGVSAWRERMGTDEGQALYTERGATAECVNAHFRNRGLQQFPVVGPLKVKAVLLWQALAHNLRRGLLLAPQWLLSQPILQP